MVKAESPACTINSTFSRVVASVWVKAQVKAAAKQSSWGLMGWIRTVLPAEKLKSLSERLCTLLQMLGVDSIVKQSLSCQEELTTVSE